MFTFLDLIYPPRCPICDGVRFFDEPVCCSECGAKVIYVSEPFCMCCGRPLSRDDREFCFDCSKKKRSYQNGLALGVYEGALRESVIRCKFHGRQAYASWYAEELVKRQGDRLVSLRADAIVPVPMHPRKQNRRGYNQAACFGAELSKRIDVPLVRDVLLRTRFTEPQKELNDTARLQNLLDAFAVSQTRLSEYKKNHPFERVILVDDIYTTGSTMEACARLLRESGVTMIAPVTIAVASGHEG